LGSIGKNLWRTSFTDSGFRFNAINFFVKEKKISLALDVVMVSPPKVKAMVAGRRVSLAGTESFATMMRGMVSELFSVVVVLPHEHNIMHSMKPQIKESRMDKYGY
jgi:hypothetical protein